MALIVAIVGSVLGLFVGMTSTFVFGTSIFTGIAIYFSISFSAISVCVGLAMLPSRRHLGVGMSHEDFLDDSWQDYASEISISASEQAFLEQLETPLSARERARGIDKDTA